MIKLLLKSIRIGWASKTLNMYLLALVYFYFSGLVITNPYKILSGLIMVCLLWGALYSLNDYTDIESDCRNPQKQDRAFVNKEINKKLVLSFIGIIILSIFIISILFFPWSFTIILVLMFLNQIIYTLPPFRLKNTSLAPFTSTATNSVLRTASCCVLLGNIFIVPLSVYIFIYIAGLGTYLLYKDKNKLYLLITMFSGMIILVYILYFGYMNLSEFAIAILPSLVAGVPLYLSVFINKNRMIQLADILYHQVFSIFFLITIIYILFI